MTSQRFSESLCPQPSPWPVEQGAFSSKSFFSGLVKTVPSRYMRSCIPLHRPLPCRTSLPGIGMQKESCDVVLVPTPWVITLQSLASRSCQQLWQDRQELPFPSLASLLFFLRAHWAGLICSKTDLCTFQS